MKSVHVLQLVLGGYVAASPGLAQAFPGAASILIPLAASCVAVLTTLGLTQNPMVPSTPPVASKSALVAPPTAAS